MQDHAHEVYIGIADRLRLEEIVRESLDPVPDCSWLCVAEVRAIRDDIWLILYDEP